MHSRPTHKFCSEDAFKTLNITCLCWKFPSLVFDCLTVLLIGCPLTVYRMHELWAVCRKSKNTGNKDWIRKLLSCPSSHIIVNVKRIWYITYSCIFDSLNPGSVCTSHFLKAKLTGTYFFSQAMEKRHIFQWNIFSKIE